jgi:hypothetical protein
VTASLRRRVSDALVARGFRRGHAVYQRSIDEDFQLVVGIGPLDGRADVSPSIGLRHEGVENLCSRLLNLEPYDFGATVGGNVGQILGAGYWRFPESVSPDEVLAAIDQATPVVLRFARLDRLPRGLLNCGSRRTRTRWWHSGPTGRTSPRFGIGWLSLTSRAAATWARYASSSSRSGRPSSAKAHSGAPGAPPG